MHHTFSSNKLIDDKSNSFKNDYTGRLEQAAKSFTTLIESESDKSPLVLHLNAPYGVGKTTFIDMWGQSLLNSNKLAIKFDAWKADHYDNPLLSIISQIGNQLENMENSKKSIENFKKAGASLCKAIIPATLKFVINALLELSKIEGSVKEYAADLTDAANRTIESGIEDEINNYASKADTLDNFKNILRNTAQNKTLFIFVDELDRCKPTFAISLLEVIKHIFDIENVCFILSTNIKALAHSVQSIYGQNEVEAKDYLERFMDFPLTLIEPDRLKFIEYQVKRLKIDISKNPDSDLFFQTIISSCNSAEFSLRVIEKYLRDVHLFLKLNENVDVNKRVPYIYYPAIATKIAEKRIHDPFYLNQMHSKLSNSVQYKLINDFFISSASNEALTQQAQKLNEKMNSIKNKGHRDSIEGKMLSILEYLRDEILYSLYGGTSPDIKKYIGSIVVKINSYVNHYENAKQITNLLEWTEPGIISDAPHLTAIS